MLSLDRLGPNHEKYVSDSSGWYASAETVVCAAPNSAPEIAARNAEVQKTSTWVTRVDAPPVLLVDEVDRSDEEFEAFLLEVLSDHQVTIPEIGTVRATHPPHVVLTSNRTRELSEALRRRCLYLWVDYPSFDKEVRIVRAKTVGVAEQLANEVVRFIQRVRRRRLAKTPGVAESLDWAQALVALGADALGDEVVDDTLGCVLKDEGDIREVRTAIGEEGLGAFVVGGAL